MSQINEKLEELIRKNREEELAAAKGLMISIILSVALWILFIILFLKEW